eukprot:scaffold65935_cov33-Prasinocladus_malaysianus.AAC.1
MGLLQLSHCRAGRGGTRVRGLVEAHGAPLGPRVVPVRARVGRAALYRQRLDPLAGPAQRVAFVRAPKGPPVADPSAKRRVDRCPGAIRGPRQTPADQPQPPPQHPHDPVEGVGVRPLAGVRAVDGAPEQPGPLAGD